MNPLATNATHQSNSLAEDNGIIRHARSTHRLIHSSFDDKIEKLIRCSWEDIDKNNKIVAGFKQLGTKGALRKVRNRCEELRSECEHKVAERACAKTERTNTSQQAIEQEYEIKILDYLQLSLNVKATNTRDQKIRNKELGDIIFYCLKLNEEPHEHVQRIIFRLCRPLHNHMQSSYNYSWYELCCVVLDSEHAFAQFYERLDNNKVALTYLLYKQPQLLLNKQSDSLINFLLKYLQYGAVHQMFTNVRDRSGQTCMFSIGWYEQSVRMYYQHTDDLYSLLSVKNTNGETALHINPEIITFLLADVYVPKQQDKFLQLISIGNRHGTTALQTARGLGEDLLSEITNRVRNNEYIVNTWFYTNILIIYNTKNRPGADEEARQIEDACKLKFKDSNITLRKDQNQRQILELINQAASATRCGLPFKLFMIILASHGHVGTIYDCEGTPIKLSSIEAAACSRQMEGRPKLLITQSCQNRGLNRLNEKVYQPTHDHFCAVMSCVDGEDSERGAFLGKFAQEIRQSDGNTNIFQLVNRVSAEMERDGHQQTLLTMSTMKATLCVVDSWLFSK